MRRLAAKIATVLLVVLLVGVLAVVGKAWWDSRLPGTYSVMDYGTVDYGGGPEAGGHGHGSHGGGISVADLHGPSAPPDARFALTARHATIHLASGREVEALTFDGRAPGPELRVRQGDLVEVTLANQDVDEGVTIHWHGVDVPNAEDGVAGVTQDAVLPGERHVYRFRADQVGTFWYHTHQVASKEVRRGLFGAFVIEPKGGSTFDVDETIVAHTFDGVPALNRNDSAGRERVAAGTPVRLRLVNTDGAEQRLTVTGTPFRVLAVDGTDLHEPGVLENVGLLIPAGGRFDVGFTMPDGGVRVGIEGTDAAIGLGPDGAPAPEEIAPTEDFDPLSYGEPAPTPFDASSAFDRRFDFTITRKPGFHDGLPGLQWAINGGIHPDVPTFVVDEGDLVEVTITNDSKGIHPMHLHGHHVLVLSRDGVPASGSPWWSDTLNVRSGETYVVAFRADNPGLWMDHCHNLRHAADGLTMHVAYAGVSTPFEVGAAHHNTPE